MGFDLDKKNTLFKLQHGDKSKKGALDEDIRSLVETINAHHDFYTTSSCSGRILFLTYAPDRQRHLTQWHLVSHKTISLDEITALQLPKTEVWLIMGSFILHVCARTLDTANTLLNRCHTCGLKHTGIIALNRRIMLEIIGNENIEMPIASNGKWLIEEKGLRYVLLQANKKLRLNHVKLKTLEHTFTK